MSEKRANRRTNITYDALFNKHFKHMTDASIASQIGIPTSSVKALPYRGEVSTEVIRKICEHLHCQPGDIMQAEDIEVIPAKAME